MNKYTIITSIIGIFLLTAIVLYGCAASNNPQSVRTEKTGVELWSQHCGRCHQTPPRTAFNDAEWETVGLHMRVRAKIAGEEAEEIIDFLRTSR